MAPSLPVVFPRPRHVEVLGSTGRPVERSVTHDPELPPQGYALEVTATGTDVRHADDKGLRYARQTLEQLAAAEGCPALVVRDHPDLARRGFMLDVSRDRVPTRATLEDLVGVLDALRYDHLELYVEHTFAYEGQEVVWGAASPLTSEDLRWLDDRCAEVGIELVANQNTFGHMERWLRRDVHRWRAECADGATSPFTGRPMPATTLAPTPENAAFAAALVREQAAALRSTTVHIGADEPFELGQGVSSARVAAEGRPAVYVEHLVRIAEPLLAEGRQVLFWGDVMRRDAALVAGLPAGLVPVIWHYDAPAEDPGLLGALPDSVLADLGLPDGFHRGFAAHLRAVVEAGREHWVAPGTSSWNSLVGRWAEARPNLLDAASAGAESGASGLLVTDWGDNGHLQPLVVSLLPLAYGAGVAWCAATNAAVDVTPVVDRLAGQPGLGALLVEAGTLHQVPGIQTANGSPLFGALDPGRPLPLVGRGEPAALADLVEETEALLQRAESLGRLDLLAALRLARHGAWRLARRGGVEAISTATEGEDLLEARHLQAEAWLATSRPGGLEDSLRHLPDPDDGGGRDR
ncbi:MAG: glycoside hydrolase family 20 zincin-like fold domain-containing protein [Actinomycetota bacterium]